MTYMGLQFPIQLGDPISESAESLEIQFPIQGPCATNDHSQCKALGNEAGSNGGMLCDVECTNRSVKSSQVKWRQANALFIVYMQVMVPN